MNATDDGILTLVNDEYLLKESSMDVTDDEWYYMMQFASIS